jgi:DNA-binding response OmpR family regulator
VLRRGDTHSERFELLRAGDLLLDERAHQVTRAGEPIALTPIEFDLLAVLMRSPGRVFERAELVDVLADSGFAGVDTTLNVHIRNLRLKIEPDPAHPRWIETVFGIGYRFQKVD